LTCGKADKKKNMEAAARIIPCRRFSFGLGLKQSMMGYIIRERALNEAKENPLYFLHKVCYNGLNMAKRAALSRFLLTKVRTQAL